MNYHWNRITPLTVALSLLALALIILLLISMNALDTNNGLAILVAAVVAIIGWFSVARISARTDILLKSSESLVEATKNYSSSLSYMAGTMAHRYSVYAPEEGVRTSANYWNKSIRLFHDDVIKDRTKQSDMLIELRQTLEAHRLPIAPIGYLCDYISLSDEKLSEKFDTCYSRFKSRIPNVHSETEFVEAVNEFADLAGDYIVASVLANDLKTEIVNFAQSKVFGYSINRRIPNDDSKTLIELASPEVVEKMKRDLDAKWINI